MIKVDAPSFEHPQIGDMLDAMTDDVRDGLDFGVIGFDRDKVVRVYNAFESTASGLSRDIVLGHPLFKEVAVCMDNYLVAQRFDDTDQAGIVLDEILPYVLTLRMRPTRVALRLLATPGAAIRYVLIDRR